MRTFFRAPVVILFVIFSFFDPIISYPIDGYKNSGIRRLQRLQLIIDGKLKGTMPPPGARKSISEIQLNLLNPRGDSLDVLPPVDKNLQKRIDALFPDRHESYSLAILEITPGKPMRFAQRQSERQFAPGSVGKLLIAAGIFHELKQIFPDSVEKRNELLRTRMVVADKWIHTDHHEVPVFNPEDNTFASRAVKEGDVFSLYEWLDHMLSASANSAASIVWKELVLMHVFGANYPPGKAEEEEFFKNTNRQKLSEIAHAVVNNPIREAGIGKQDWQLGSFFTQTGKKIIPGAGGSFATPVGYLKYLIALERGKIVDPWSSLEIKRLMYMTARRIRYASSPALNNASVYFKSGSIYRCKPEPEFECKKYMGNVENIMNSVIIVEQPGSRIYLVGLMSNILKKNSAGEHQSLATFIDRILAK
jgi:hypothetical protein